jgi:hypothetical protein
MYPKNLITKLPNLMMLPRPTDLYFSDKDQGFLYSMVGGGGSDGMGNPSAIGFDWSCTNKSGVKITVLVDGVAYTILDGEIKSVSGVPFDRFQISDTSGATTANAVDVALLGMDMQQIIELTKTEPNFHLWS